LYAEGTIKQEFNLCTTIFVLNKF